MSDYENDFLDDLLEPMSDPSKNTGHVPKFERDLAKHGSLEAIAAERAKNDGISIESSAPAKTPLKRPAKPPLHKEEAPKSSLEEINFEPISSAPKSSLEEINFEPISSAPKSSLEEIDFEPISSAPQSSLEEIDFEPISSAPQSSLEEINFEPISSAPQSSLEEIDFEPISSAPQSSLEEIEFDPFSSATESSLDEIEPISFETTQPTKSNNEYSYVDDTDEISDNEISFEDLVHEEHHEENLDNSKYYVKKDSDFNPDTYVKPRSVLDFARETELRRQEEIEKQNKLNEMDMSSFSLESMDYEAPKKKVEKKDEKITLDPSTVFEDMSQEYAKKAKTMDDYTSKEKLNKTEKQQMKDRLEQELGRKPEAERKKLESIRLMRKLKDEQDHKKFLKGLYKLLVVVVLQLGVSSIIYLFLNVDNNEMFQYISYAFAGLSLFLLAKMKVVKNITVLTYLLGLVFIVWQGLIPYIANASSSSDDYVFTIAMFIVSIVVTVFSMIFISFNSDIDMYYAYQKLDTSKKKKIL